MRPEKEWQSFMSSMQKLYALDGQIVDPKEVLSSSFYKVFDTREEALRDARVRAYKKGQGIGSEDDIDQLIEDLVDDLIDGF